LLESALSIRLYLTIYSNLVLEKVVQWRIGSYTQTLQKYVPAAYRLFDQLQVIHVSRRICVYAGYLWVEGVEIYMAVINKTIITLIDSLILATTVVT